MSDTTSSQWQPLPRLRTHEQVVAEIENRLNSGKLKAGDRLPPERQFAEALGVSRGAVREALRILEAIGVVEAGTGSGPTSGSRIVKDSTVGMGMVLRIHLQLASFTQDDMIETRLMLERLTCHKAAGVVEGDHLNELRRLVTQMRGPHTVAEYNDLDTAFHVGIAQMSGNGLAAAMMAAMREAMRQAMVAGFENLDDPAGTMSAVTDEHQLILDAIAAGDGDGAAELVTKHIMGFYHVLGLGTSTQMG
ncbi:FadR/GntR family transcriptional regulator [Mycolicibacterium vaccae]|uniref:GntR family transcriptional regulator n=1 Tax=Mycolicibacterium vaccae ATCC 25954 TaxID=1194972 RepID=K0V3Y8_MYCVA|nr:FadR/GntR family transcriptional regulator [Mycolicibacterium vaccae]ANI38158.1 GntR family transcriptional regulator [Mycolicibacterium vaccae 95051]EJZ12155.1 GntR family transcriptional regulator [Mycolicibacterium vaccae ATCC 25954]